jgi:hypothetical protein
VKQAGRILAVLLLVVATLVLVRLAATAHDRCTTELTPVPSTAVGTAPSGPAAAPSTAGAPTSVAPGTTTALQPTKRTCSPPRFTDPPVLAPALVVLLLAIPLLSVSELDVPGFRLRRAVKDASEAARSASTAADRAASAALTVANVASARSAALSQASGNVVVFGGGPVRDEVTAEVALAFKLAAYGVAETVAQQPGVRHAVVLWLDRSTDSLRPHSNEKNPGVDMRSPLGDAVRRAQPGVVVLQTDEDVHAVGLPIAAPATAVAVPAARARHPAVGLVLAVTDGTVPSQDVSAAVAPFGVPAAILIERLTAAGATGRIAVEEPR